MVSIDSVKYSGTTTQFENSNTKKETDLESEARLPDCVEGEPVITPKTWLVVFILAAGYGLSFWPVPLMAAIGPQVATQLGGTGKSIWFIPAWTLAISIVFMICGANTDLLGRRWFLVGGNVICFIGHLVAGTAKNANAVIAGMALTGFGGANCQMAAFALPELLPNKWRHKAVVLADWVTYLSIVLSPVTGRFGFESNTWRWNFYACAILQFFSFLGLYFLYFPPAHPLNIPVWQVIKEIDYLGAFFFTAGTLPLLLGIVWTTIYPSTDPHVIASLTVGFVFLLAFSIWERYGNLKHPLTPTYVFSAAKGRDLTAPLIALFVINMSYYSANVLWPTMITVFYTNDGANWRYAVVLSLPQGLGVVTGAVLLVLFGSSLRHWQWTLTAAVFIMVLFGALLALATPTNKGLMVVFVFLNQVGFGWAIYLSIAISQMGVEHKNLGLSGGISGCFRFAAGAIATAVYTTILTNTVTKYTALLVPTAAITAGLHASDLPVLLELVGTPSFATVYSPAIVEAVGDAVKEAYVHGIQLCAYTSIAFGIIGIAACACCSDIDAKMNNKIEVYLAKIQNPDADTEKIQ